MKKIIDSFNITLKLSNTEKYYKTCIVHRVKTDQRQLYYELCEKNYTKIRKWELIIECDKF